MSARPALPLWSTPVESASQRARELHRSLTNTDATACADAPATFSVIGEHTDHAGGVVLMGLSDLRAAAATSPRSDDIISITIQPARGERYQASVTLTAMEQLCAEHQAESSEQSAADIDAATRLGTLMCTLIQRQLLSRETAGVNITVVSDIPAHVGLGESVAIDTAVALSLLADSPDLAESPVRTKIAEVAFHAVDTFSADPELRARYTVALRGQAGTVSTIDYADGSLTQAPHVITKDTHGFVVGVPDEPDPQEVARGREIIAQQQDFVAEACHAFGADSLRHLPDATNRVVEWLTAVHKVRGPEGTPSTEDAHRWLTFLHSETEAAQLTARALRSRRNEDLGDILAASQKALEQQLGFVGSRDLAHLCVSRGATSARAAAAGRTSAVLALVPAARAHNFATDLAADGLLVIPLTPGAHVDLS